MSSMQSSSGSVDSRLVEPWSWNVGSDHNKDKKFAWQYIFSKNLKILEKTTGN